MSKRKKTDSVVVSVPDVVSTLSAYEQGLYTAEQAATLMGVSRATFHRKFKVWRETGVVPQHGNAKRTPSNKIPEETRQRIVELVETKYYDFQPSLLRNYLEKYENIRVSTEWLRRLLKEMRPDETGKASRQKAHLLRRRRSSRGQLLQIDGSQHQWFENDEDKYCLIVFIDDATNAIEAAGFFPTESVHGYVTVLRDLLVKHGLPVAFYSDRHSIFTSNVGPARERKSNEPTQFQRICEMLGIDLILAHSPQAKGRVERANQTLQGRWVKEFRVLGIKTAAEANERIPEMIEEYNREFAICPAEEEDSYISLTEGDLQSLEFIFGIWHRRTISRNLTVSFRKEILQIIGVGSLMRTRLQKSDVQVVEFCDGRKELYWCDEIEWRDSCRRQGHPVRKTYRRLQYKAHERWGMKPKSEDYKEPPPETAKTLDHRVDESVRHRSPWGNSMNQWAEEAIRRREERQKKVAEAQKLEERIQRAKEALKPKK